MEKKQERRTRKSSKIVNEAQEHPCKKTEQLKDEKPMAIKAKDYEKAVNLKKNFLSPSHVRNFYGFGSSFARSETAEESFLTK